MKIFGRIFKAELGVGVGAVGGAQRGQYLKLQTVRKSPGRSGALSWLGEAHTGEALRTLRQRLPTSTLTEIVGARSRLPTWLAEQVSQVIVNA